MYLNNYYERKEKEKKKNKLLEKYVYIFNIRFIYLNDLFNGMKMQIAISFYNKRRRGSIYFSLYLLRSFRDHRILPSRAHKRGREMAKGVKEDKTLRIQNLKWRAVWNVRLSVRSLNYAILPDIEISRRGKSQ